MAWQPAALLLFAALGLANQGDGPSVAVPADFPKAFIVAIVVSVVCVVVFLALICVLAHCWQHICGLWRRPVRRRASSAASSTSSSSVAAAGDGNARGWLDPVFEWPQQLTPRARRDARRNRDRGKGVDRERKGRRLRERDREKERRIGTPLMKDEEEERRRGGAMLAGIREGTDGMSEGTGG
ncbi:hypothetical protein AAE478_005391 [Parahypoxylon ruwenzoriense]